MKAKRYAFSSLALGVAALAAIIGPGAWADPLDPGPGSPSSPGTGEVETSSAVPLTGDPLFSAPSNLVIETGSAELRQLAPEPAATSEASILATPVAPTTPLTALAQPTAPDEPPSSPVPAPSVVRKGDVVARVAAVYAGFQADVGEISSRPFGSAEELDAAVDQFGGQSPRALASGWIAYAAMHAASVPEFRAAVLDVDAHYGREAMLRGLRNDLSWVRRELKGSQAALDAAMVAVDADARRLIESAERVRYQGYTLQKSPWALKATNDGEVRVAALKLAALAGRPLRAAALALMEGPQIDGQLADTGRAGARSLWDSTSGTFGGVVQFASLSTPTFFQARQPVLNPVRSYTADRILTVAAYRVLGETSDSLGQIANASADLDAIACQERANLMFLSCVRSNKFRYERPVCISEHVIGDLGKCMKATLQ